VLPPQPPVPPALKVIPDFWLDNFFRAKILDTCLFPVSDQLYLVSGSNGIAPNTKLKYFAKEDPTTEFWTSWTQAWANQKKCSRCSIHGQVSALCPKESEKRGI
jgi:hypothetical protein